MGAKEMVWKKVRRNCEFIDREVAVLKLCFDVLMGELVWVEWNKE